MHLAALVSYALSLLPSAQSDWPQFRGPGGRCVASDAPIPVRFGPDASVRWKARVPAGHSSPCVVGGRIFVTGFEEGRDVVVAVERASGKELWRKTFEGPAYPEVFHPDARPGQPTPVADGERVVAYFGNYGLVALSHEGEVLWEKRLAQPRAAFGIGTSPILFEGMVIVARDGAAEASILVLDSADGSELHRIDRVEYSESHGTPFLWNHAERSELVVVGSGRLCSYDPGSGEKLWTMGGMTSFPCTTPTADGETLYFAGWSTPNATGRSFWEGAFARSLDISDAEVADPALLFKRLDANGDEKVVPAEVPECRAKDAFGFLDRDQSGTWELAEILAAATFGEQGGENIMVAVARGAKGDLTKADARWSWNRGLPYVSSPLLYRGRIWLLQAGGLVSVLEAATGKPIVDRERLSDRSEYYMSPVGAAGHVLVGSAEGTLYLLAAEADGLVVEHTAVFDEELFATPAVLDGVVYLRSEATLWAFGE
jgi:outer membrane protein assembly factor BamB